MVKIAMKIVRTKLYLEEEERQDTDDEYEEPGNGEDEEEADEGDNNPRSDGTGDMKNQKILKLTTMK